MRPGSIKSEKMHPCRQYNKPKGDKREQIGANWSQNGAKGCQKGANGSQRDPKGSPKGSQREPKGPQREPTGAKREPNGVQNASKSRSKLDIRKRSPKSHQLDSNIYDFGSHFT